jgi:segregation and condensation protein B
MEIANLINHVEALIFASEKPLSAIELVELINNAFGFMEEKVGIDQVETSIEGIREKYAAEFYPFELRQSGGGWQFLTKKEFHQTIAQLNGDKFLKRLSTAALETLAIIAYKQPITKSEIEAIRGVNCDYSIQKLLEKELIVISGRNEEMVGKPLIYATSRHFMDYFGINSSDELPQISEVLAEQMVTPTLVNADHFEMDGAMTMDDASSHESAHQRSDNEALAEEDNTEETSTEEEQVEETTAVEDHIEIERIEIQEEVDDPTEEGHDPATEEDQRPSTEDSSSSEQD